MEKIFTYRSPYFNRYIGKDGEKYQIEFKAIKAIERSQLRIVCNSILKEVKKAKQNLVSIDIYLIKKGIIFSEYLLEWIAYPYRIPTFQTIDIDLTGKEDIFSKYLVEWFTYPDRQYIFQIVKKDYGIIPTAPTPFMLLGIAALLASLGWVICSIKSEKITIGEGIFGFPKLIVVLGILMLSLFIIREFKKGI